MNDMKDLKREAVYEAVITLMEKGGDQSTIKVSDIAAEAGIGKGTVYEYFSSREEIIAKTIIYYIDSYLKKAERIFDKKAGFRERLNGILDIIANESGRSEFFIDVLLSTAKVKDIYKILKKANIAIDFEKDVTEYLEKLIDGGKNEGIIGAGTDMEYASFVIRSAIGGYLGLQYKMNVSRKEKITKKQYVYDMVVSALG